MQESKLKIQIKIYRGLILVEPQLNIKFLIDTIVLVFY